MIGKESNAVNIPCTRNVIPAVEWPSHELATMAITEERPRETVIGTPLNSKTPKAIKRIVVIMPTSIER